MLRFVEIRSVRWEGMKAAQVRPSAASVCGLKLLVYADLSY
jgi:hypothetical protein